jgi:hypothetical protein
VADPETVDDGNNVLDGFTFEVDGFDEGDVITFNWELLDSDGQRIGSPGSGNGLWLWDCEHSPRYSFWQ